MNIVLVAAAVLVVDRVTKELALRQARGVVRVVFTERPLLARGASLRAEVALWLAAAACAVGALLFAPLCSTTSSSPPASLPAPGGRTGQSGRPPDPRCRGGTVSLGRWRGFNLADVAIVRRERQLPAQHSSETR